MNRAGFVLLAAAAAALVLFAVGPRPDVTDTPSFVTADIGSDLDAWLAGREGSVAGLKAGAQKQVVWADPTTRTRTPIALVYVHGFSATHRETSPLAETIAADLGANLFMTRLAGHGGDGAMLAEARLRDWADDMAEAIAIGRRLGERVVVLGVSTGGTLAVWAAARPDLAPDALVLVSPNFALRAAPTALLNMPWAETILPAAMGRERSFQPNNDAHAQWWTTRYPSTAVFPMAALLKRVEAIDPASLTVPAMFVFSPLDQVVDPGATERVAAAWGGPKTILRVETSDDPAQHVIAGDILSPSTTTTIAGAVTAFLQGPAGLSAPAR